MEPNARRYLLSASLLFLASLSYGQSDSSGNSDFLLYSLIALGVFLLVWAVLNLTDNLMQIEAQKRGADTTKQNFSIFPGRELFRKRPPKYTGDIPFHSLTKGHDIKLVGGVDGSSIEHHHPSRVAIKPPDFRGIAPIPKLVVQVGDEVKAGDQIFYDKLNPDISYAAPVSGEIVEIVRGGKRAIEAIVILADKEQQYRAFDVPALDSVSRDELAQFMAGSGLWPFINQRPFDVVPGIGEVPRDIFISTFDTAPLAIDQNMVVNGREAAFQKGLDVLNLLTSGSVHLGLNGNGTSAPHNAFVHAQGVEKAYFQGAHPAGNVGVQIHHTKPINSSDTVWTLEVKDAIAIGELFLHGRFNSDILVGITGSEVIKPTIIKTVRGANVSELLKNRISSDNKVRLIDGNVLTGQQIDEKSFLSTRSNQITAIKEGEYYELFGWLLPLKPRPTVSRTYPNFLFPNHQFEGDTNTHGEKRAFVMTGQYEEVLPMNIFPMHIMKAIMANDFERMEGLGLAELSEEDVALCEFVCTSKMPLQSILRQGLDMMREQM